MPAGGQTTRKRQAALKKVRRSSGAGRAVAQGARQANGRGAGNAVSRASRGKRGDFGRKPQRVSPKVRRALTGAASIGPDRNPAGNVQGQGLTQPFRKSKLNKRIDAGEVIAPGLEILKQLGRFSSGASRAYQASTHPGTDTLDAFNKGFMKNDSSFGKVFHEQGLPKGAAAVLGFGADVLTDPTTFTTFGVGSGLRKATLKAGEAAAAKAAKQGLSEAAQENLRKAAMRQFLKPRTAEGEKALARAKARGLKVKFAGAEVPGVRRATSRNPLRGKSESGLKAGARDVGHEVNPRIRPAGQTAREHVVVRDAQRRARGVAGQGVIAGGRKAVPLQKLPAEDLTVLRGAVESNRPGRYLAKAGRDDLAPHLRDFTAEMKFQRRQAVRGGVPIPELQTTKTVTKRAAAKLAKEQAAHPTGRDVTEYLKKAEAQAAKVEATHAHAQGYVPRSSKAAMDGDAVDPNPMIPETVGKNPRVSAKKTRKLRDKFPQAQAKSDVPLSENLPLVTANYIGSLGKAQGRAVVNRALLDAGRELKRVTKVVVKKDGRKVVKRGWEAPNLKPGESVYRIHSGGMIERVPHGTKVPKSGQSASGRMVVLKDEVVNRAMPDSAFTGRGSQALKSMDAFQGKWKHLAILTPQYHSRNLLGDMTNHYLYAHPWETARAAPKARKVVKALNRNERAMAKTGGRAERKPVEGSVFKVGKAKGLTPEGLAQEMLDQGVVRAGQVGGELRQLRKAGDPASLQSGATIKLSQHGGTLKRAGRMGSETREDFPRAMTYTVARMRGLDPARAARKAMDHHFDYRELSMVERDFLRRAMPFYTFSARNIPLQSRTLLAKPGKYANIEKLRREADVAGGAGTKWQKAAANLKRLGVDPPDGATSWDTYLSQYDKQGQPVAAFGRALGYQPPTSDISVLGSAILSAANLNPGIFADQVIGRTGQMIGPYKTPLEIWSNNSLFFKDQIQNKNAPLSPAPAWVTKLPKQLKQALGVVDDRVNRRSGEPGPGWPAKVDYALRNANPGVLGFLNNLATNQERRNVTQAEKIANFLTGVKSVPLDEDTVYLGAMGRLFRQLDSVQEKAGAKGQQASGEAEKKRLNKQAAHIQEQINAISKLLGYKKPLFEKGGRKKVRRSGDPLGLDKPSGPTTDPLGLDKPSGPSTDPLKLG